MEKIMPIRFKIFAGLMALTLLGMPAAAQTVTSSVRLTGPLHPQSQEEARILLDRVKMAASQVCGAAKFSVVDYSRAVRRSPCWQHSVSEAVAHIASPLLWDVYGRETR